MRTAKLWLARLATAASIAFPFVVAAHADPVGDFYAGKTLTIIVGSDVGGGYDANARLMARHLGRFIPGYPATVVRNMPGAGSIVATNYLYNIAPKDGTYIGLIQRGNLMVKLTEQKVAFDPEKINWIGNLAAEPGLIVAWHTAPQHSAADLFTQPFVVGGTGPIGENETIPRLLNYMVGTKFKVISGYPSNSAVLMAMERGEVQGDADWAWSNIKYRHADLLREGKIRLLMLSGVEKEPDLPNVPLALDYAKNATDRKAMQIYFSLKNAARPVMAPPSVPEDRIKALRDGFMAMAKDPDFITDAKTSGLDVDPTSGHSVQEVAELVSSATPQVANRLRAAIAPPGTAAGR